MVNCEECHIDFKDNRDLHKHLKSHGMIIVDYYHKHFPRKDLYTKELIKFKNKDQYLNDDFNTKINMKKWLKEQPIEISKEYCKNLLLKRKASKNLTYTLSQVELKSLISPPIQYFNEIFGDYYKLCEELGFKNKYSLQQDITEDPQWKGQEYQIFIDTREQKPLKFQDRETKVTTLKFGDYSFSNEEASCNCHIERKSLSDFIGTVSSGYERFNNEVKRAIAQNASLIILIEESFQNALSFQYLPHISKKIKATPEFVFHRTREMIQEYPSIQFLFVDGRVEASRVIEKIFTSKCVYKTIDLQLAYDRKLL